MLVVDDDHGLLAGLDTSLSFAAAAVASAAALVYGARSGRGRVAAGVVCAVFAFLAVDMATHLHERLSDRAADLLPVPRATDHWPTTVLYAPLFAAAAAALWRYPGPGRAIARVAVVALGAALSLRPVALTAVVFTSYEPGGPSREVGAALQDGLELAGWLLVAGAAVTTAAARGRRRAPAPV